MLQLFATSAVPFGVLVVSILSGMEILRVKSWRGSLWAFLLLVVSAGMAALYSQESGTTDTCSITFQDLIC